MDFKNIKQDDRPVHSYLEVIDADTGVREVLREFAFRIEAPNWTRDGRYLVYNSGGLIYTYELATGEVRQVDTGFATGCNNDHVLSPDGEGLAISHGTLEDGISRIYTLPLAGGVPVLVTPEPLSFLHGWSPDGGTLAYTALRGGSFSIHTIPVAGGAETRLTGEEGNDDGPEYSPDGKYIWFNSTRSGLMQVWRMEADGQNPVQMTDEESNNWFPHLSPDGARVCYLAYRKGDLQPHEHLPNLEVELRLMPAAGGKSQTIASLFGGQGTINVNSWAPDAKRFAFVSYSLA